MEKSSKWSWKDSWYLYVVITTFILSSMIVNIFDGEIPMNKAARIFLYLFIPTLVYFVIRVFQYYSVQKKYVELQERYETLRGEDNFLRAEFIARDLEWNYVSAQVGDIIWEDCKDKKKLALALQDLEEKMEQVDDQRLRRIAFIDDEEGKRWYPYHVLYGVRKLLGIDYGENKYDDS